MGGGSYDATPARAAFEKSLPVHLHDAPPERPPAAPQPVPPGTPPWLHPRSDPSVSARERDFGRNRWRAALRNQLWRCRLRGSARRIGAAWRGVLARRVALQLAAEPAAVLTAAGSAATKPTAAEPTAWQETQVEAVRNSTTATLQLLTLYTPMCHNIS